MPLYEYECGVCGVMEIVHPMSEKLTACPNCNLAVKKLVTGCQINMGEHTISRSDPDRRQKEKYTDWEKSENTQYRVKHGQLAYEKDLKK